MFIHAVESEYLEVKEYSSKNYDDIIKTFLHEYEDIYSKTRFNLVLNNKERSYIDWAKYNTGQSRTKIIKNSINKTMKNDKDYQRYLNTEAIWG